MKTDTFIYNVAHEKTRLFMAEMKNIFISAMQGTKKPPLIGWLDGWVGSVYATNLSASFVMP